MFDVYKIQRMAATLKKFANEHDNIYLVLEDFFTPNEVALFKRLGIKIRAIMSDITSQKELLGVPIIKTAEAVKNFNANTALIIITTKPTPLIETTFDFKVGGGTWTIPAFTISVEETSPIYDRLAVQSFIEIYRENGTNKIPPPQ